MIRLFTAADETAWDDFVLNHSINGNFLQTRNFLNYHPSGRFVDVSLLYYDAKNNLRAAIPAAVVEGEKGKSFVSHPGSTYGGIVIDEKSCSAKRLQAIIDDLLSYLKSNGFIAADLRFPPSFLCKDGCISLMEYMLQLNGFSVQHELTTYVDLTDYKDDITANFSQGKRTDIHNALKAGFTYRSLESEKEIGSFYGLLENNLQKHNAKPVHSLDELIMLNEQRLADESELVGVFLDGELIAGGWLFLFENQHAVHTQYLCADDALSKISPMTFLYYSIIKEAKEKGYQKVSWGISTEEHGTVLNWGLTESKESYGSKHDTHKRFAWNMQ